jgi:thioredoxin
MEMKLTDDNFNQEVLESDVLVMVDFYADWCGPCKMMAPVVEELAKEYDGVIKVGKLNVDEAPNTSSKYRVMSIPTMVFFKNGEAVETVVGAVAKAKLSEIIEAKK